MSVVVAKNLKKPVLLIDRLQIIYANLFVVVYFVEELVSVVADLFDYNFSVEVDLISDFLAVLADFRLRVADFHFDFVDVFFDFAEYVVEFFVRGTTVDFVRLDLECFDYEFVENEALVGYGMSFLAAWTVDTGWLLIGLGFCLFANLVYAELTQRFSTWHDAWHCEAFAASRTLQKRIDLFYLVEHV